jgi:hypothetical protein
MFVLDGKRELVDGLLLDFLSRLGRFATLFFDFVFAE